MLPYWRTQRKLWKALTYAEAKPLQDYMMHRVLDLADACDLPVQLHTGLNTAYK